MRITKSDNKIVLQPVSSFTERLSGGTAKSFGQTTEEIQKHLDEGRKERRKGLSRFEDWPSDQGKCIPPDKKESD
jgi:hypothetical protein